MRAAVMTRQRKRWHRSRDLRLLGFADATCTNLFPAEQAAPRATSRPRRRAPTSAFRPRTPARILPSRHNWPSYPEPAGRHTARYADSHVRGHPPRLPQGQTARDDALDQARQLGIILRPGRPESSLTSAATAPPTAATCASYGARQPRSRLPATGISQCLAPWAGRDGCH